MNMASTKRSTPKFLQLSVAELLTAFAAGNATPGSGSAAALNGLMACSLIKTIAIKSISKMRPERANETERRRLCEFALTRIEPKVSCLAKLYERDAEVFSGVIAARRARDQASSAVLSKRQETRALQRLLKATEIVVQIAKECIAVANAGLITVKHGWKSAKGEAIAGVSNAISGALTAICVAFLNLERLKGKRARGLGKEADKAMRDLGAAQIALMQSARGMRRNALKAPVPQLRLAV